jgi:serine protease Do
MQSERGDLRTACTANLTGAGLKDKGMVSRGWIGVQIQPVTSDIAEVLGLKGPGGPLLAEPQADSPAPSPRVSA